jgi:hypothetical protein
MNDNLFSLICLNKLKLTQNSFLEWKIKNKEYFKRDYWEIKWFNHWKEIQYANN